MKYKIVASLVGLALLVFISPASSELTVTESNQSGVVPFTPTWTPTAGSLIAGLAPSTALGNFSEEIAGRNVNSLTAGGSLMISQNGVTTDTNYVTCGNDGGAGSTVIYTLPAATHGYDLTNITVYGGWKDAGRDQQAYTVYYSTVVNPAFFIKLTPVNYNPSVSSNMASATRVAVSDSMGGVLANNVAAIKFDFTSPGSENGYTGYGAITVQGAASTNLWVLPIAITTSNQNSSSSFTPTWKIETNSLIAGQLSGVGVNSGSFTVEGGVTGVGALTDGAFGPVDNLAAYATCGAQAGQSATYALNAAMITNIVVYSGWPDNSQAGQFYYIYYSTMLAPSTFIPLTGVYYNPAVTGISANRVAISTSTGVPLATNVAFLKFDFAPQGGNPGNEYSGYAEIIVQGTNGLPAQPIFGSSPMAEPYPYVSSGNFSGPAAPLSPDPLVAYRWPNPQAGDGLEIYLQKPITVSADTNSSFENLQSLTGNNPNVTVNGTGSIQMDFGRENAGWLEFDSPDLDGTVEMSISEYNEPAIVNAGAENPVKTRLPVKYGQTYRLELNKSLYEGVRFGWIHVRASDRPWHITAVRLVCQVKPANYEGSFDCSDPQLTRIWYAGAYSVKLNLLQDYFGAILMERSDRQSWTGDAHPAQAAALVAFGNRDFVKANLDRTATGDNGIESYSLYWILSLLDYYRYTGDAATLRQHLANAQAKLEHASQIYTDPPISFYGWDERLGAGFETPNTTPETKNAYRMLFIRACREFAATMRSIGETNVGEIFQKMADQRIAELRTNPRWSDRFGLHAAADSINAGFTTPAEQAQLFDREFSERATRLSFSPFNEYFVIQALARMDHYDVALASIRDDWGGQLEYGGTSFFEAFWPAWAQVLGHNDAVPNCQAGFTSLCHPWGAGVTKWLTEETLGVKPVTPGFATYEVFPHLGRTLASVSGAVPTPRGTIRVSYDVTQGQASLTAPAGTVGRLGIPTVEKTINRIRINGQVAWENGSFRSVPGIGGANTNSDFVIFNDVQPGSYAIAVDYSGETPKFTDVPWQFPATFVKEDRTTSGNWVGKYGRDGSFLFGEVASQDRVHLPGYVAGVTHSQGRAGGWSTPVDSRALATGLTNNAVRCGGVLYCGNPAPCQQCLVVDVACKQPAEYQLALYFVDLDCKGRRQSVELFDLASHKLIAPTHVYSNFTGGVYAVYNCRQSVRIRINHIRGDNAVLSGLFFDPQASP